MKEKQRKMGIIASLRQQVKRASLFSIALLMLASWVAADVLLFVQHASAAQITSRSLNLSNSAVGTRTAGQNVTYTFGFTVVGAASPVRSLDFQFCTTPLPGTDCNLPTGQSVTSAIIGADNGALADWSLGTSGNAPSNAWSNGTSGVGGRVRVTRGTATDVSSSSNVNLSFTGITNPTAPNQEFFVRIVAYTDAAWTTTRDTGTVANATSQQIDVTAKVQEVLNLSVAGDEGAVDPPLTSCEPLTAGGAVSLGDSDGALSFLQPYDAHSYFRVSTNANNGTVVYYAGDTLKYGSENIEEVGTTEAVSVAGTEQFGLAIDSADAAFSFSQLGATTGYDEGDGVLGDPDTKFAFDDASLTTPIAIAQASAPITCDTGSVRYVGNIATTTPPGLYTTSISYIATPTY